MTRILKAVILTQGMNGWSGYFIRVLRRRRDIELRVLDRSKLHPEGFSNFFVPFFRLYEKQYIKNIVKKYRADLFLNLVYERLDIYIDGLVNAYYVHVPYRGGLHPIAYYRPYIGKAINTLLKGHDYHILNRKNIFVFCNSFATYISYNRFNIPGEVVYYPFNYLKFYSDPNKLNIAVSIGVFSRFKLHEVTLKIARLVRNVKFVIIGALNDPKYYAYLKRIKPPNVILIPNATEELKIRLLSKAKFYIHSGRTEGLGVANLEGMASGAVPIVVDSGAFREVVTHDVGFRWKTPEEAAEYIEFLSRHPDIWQRLSNNTRRKVRFFSPEMFEKRIERGLTHLFNIYFQDYNKYLGD
jgi:glycosyltransferase involved in cell wall biosynthesis